LAWIAVLLGVAALAAGVLHGRGKMTPQARRPAPPAAPEGHLFDAPGFKAHEATEEVTQQEVVPKPPTDAAPADDVVETDNDTDFADTMGETEGLSDAPFEGPQTNTILGTGGGAGGALGRRGGAAMPGVGGGGRRARLPQGDPGLAEPATPGTETYVDAGENGFLQVSRQPLSTFSIDVDSASYANVRRMLREGHLPPKAAVRVEELVNYFSYAYAPPTDAKPFAVHGEIAACPWNLQHRLVRIGLKARDIDRKARPASNIVFLLDVSGSMDAPHKLPLVKASMRMLLDELSERDHVAIVTYAGASGLALPPTSCEKKTVIAEAIDKLVAGGSTNGASGITLAYDVAAQHFVAGGSNRVVLCTDGDWNVGVTSHDELWRMIGEKARTGVFLSVLGFGMGNLKDAMLEQLADRGNGVYGYVDSTREAHRLLVEQAGGSLVTVAKDVKVQVEWNPATVAGYRLVGYENRALADRDFKDDAKDAGEIGAGHNVTAFYEVVPVGRGVPAAGDGAVDPLKYQRPRPNPTEPTGSAEMLTVKLRYKEPAAATSQGFEVAFTDTGASYAQASGELKFANAVAAFALLLRDSPQKGTASYDGVLELAGEAVGPDVGGYRREFLELVTKARALSRP
jgi:Ca-activated chloride channel family protein